MAVWTGSLPPPTLAPVPLAPVGPVAFRSYRGSTSGTRNTLFIGDGQPGMFTFTGEFYRPSMLSAFRIGQVLLSFAMFASLIAAVIVAAAAENDESPQLFPALMIVAFASMLGLVIWKAVFVRSAESATLVLRATDITRVRSTVNYKWLNWWLLIGPFALIPMFAGRRLLRMEMPVSVDGRLGLLPLVLIEQRHGDAEVLVARLRMAGAH